MFVNTAPSRPMPDTLFWSSAWLDISRTAAFFPLDTISESSPFSLTRSGVVMLDRLKLSPDVFVKTVLTRPLGLPAEFRTLSIRNTVVVFPLVPVTPYTSSDPEGSPKTRLAIYPRASLVSSTTMTFPSSSRARPGTARSQMTRAAPFLSASRAKSWPSCSVPLMATNTSPSRTSLESVFRPRRSKRIPSSLVLVFSSI